MVRDVDTTFSNKQALVVPTGADLANTNATSDLTPRAHSPAGGWNLRGTIKNVDAADALTTGNFIVEVLFSTDGGSTFRTDGGHAIDIPSASLAVGEVVPINVPIGRGFFYVEGIDPADIRVRVRYRTNGHSTASVVDIEATAYLDEGGDEEEIGH